MRIERVEIVAHPSKEGVGELQDELTDFLKARGISVGREGPDLVVSIGGDGTTLRAAQRAHTANVPLLGINRGKTGYLTEVDAGGEKDALERVFADDFTLEERMVLSCHLDEGAQSSYVGLNEVLVERSSRHRLVHLGVEIGGEPLAAFDADGVIVATPTGSTAYALSAGGPIVDPRAECLVVVPVSPHVFFTRPFVLSADQVVEIAVIEASGGASLSIDGGMGCELSPGAKVVVRRDPRPLTMVRLSGPGFLERLRLKLRLPL